MRPGAIAAGRAGCSRRREEGGSPTLPHARRGAPPFLASSGLHCAFTRQAHRGGTRRRALVAVAVVVIVVAVVIVVDAAIESVPATALIRRRSPDRKATGRPLNLPEL